MDNVLSYGQRASTPLVRAEPPAFTVTLPATLFYKSALRIASVGPVLESQSRHNVSKVEQTIQPSASKVYRMYVGECEREASSGLTSSFSQSSVGGGRGADQVMRANRNYTSSCRASRILIGFAERTCLPIAATRANALNP